MLRALRSRSPLPLLRPVFRPVLTVLVLQSALQAQTPVELQPTSPGTQQNGNIYISGRGLFESRIGIGTKTPQSGLHVHEEADALAGTLALEGDTTTWMSFFPRGIAGGRHAYMGFPSPSSNTMFLANESTFGNIVLSPSGSGSVGINTVPGSYQMLSVYINRPNSYAVFADNAYPTGSTYGLFGRSSSTLGFGVYGLALSSTGSSMGVRGRSDSTTGTGVYGSTTKSTGTNYGVYGYSPSPAGYALFGNGRFAVTGTKSFVIDHPFDPERKTLTHYCTEGAEPLNVYEGNVHLDDTGSAWIDLPDYFAEINRDPRYALTAIGASMPELHVASEVHDQRFRIAGGVAGAKVSWRVSAVRNDLYVREHGAPVEQDKPAELRGKYLQPELHGEPPERGVDHDPAPLEQP